MSVKVVRSTKLICKDLSAIDSELAAMGGVRESNY